jgi:hypothetical protein
MLKALLTLVKGFLLVFLVNGFLTVFLPVAASAFAALSVSFLVI